MSDGIHPDGPSHPGPNAAYETAGNPTNKEPVESARAHINAQTDDDNAVYDPDQQPIPTS